MDLGLDGEVFIVSGATRGLGRATAEVLIAEGARVVITGRDGHSVLAAASELRTDRSLGVVADNADPTSPERVVAAAVSRFGRLDGALISTGGPPPGGFTTLTDDQWRSSFESVFLGPLRLGRAVARQLTTRGGSIAFVLSSSVRSPLVGLDLSNGLRPGLSMLTKSMADQLAPQGIRVNGLLPGRIATDRIKSLDAGLSDSELGRLRAAIPLGRDGDPAEFGRIAAFVLSHAASYLTGAMIPVDGGSIRSI